MRDGLAHKMKGSVRVKLEAGEAWWRDSYKKGEKKSASVHLTRTVNIPPTRREYTLQRKVGRPKMQPKGKEGK